MRLAFTEAVAEACAACALQCSEAATGNRPGAGGRGPTAEGTRREAFFCTPVQTVCASGDLDRIRCIYVAPQHSLWHAEPPLHCCCAGAEAQAVGREMNRIALDIFPGSSVAVFLRYGRRPTYSCAQE